jgi:predicted nucleic acid-binding protein
MSDDFATSWRPTCVNGRRWSIDTILAEHRRIALDANVLIYLVENAEPQAAQAQRLIDAIEPSDLHASMATLGQTEVLAGPARTGDASAFELTAAAIRDIGLELVPLSAEVAEDAGWLRGQGGMDLADAVHLASARAAGATAFVTNDRRIRSRPNLEVLYLDDLVLDDLVLDDPSA